MEQKRQALSTLKAGVNVRGGLGYLVLPKNLPVTMLLELHELAGMLSAPLDTIGRPDATVLEQVFDFVVETPGFPQTVPFFRLSGMEETRQSLIRMAAESLRQAHAIAMLLDARAAASVGFSDPALAETLPCDTERSS